MHPGYTKETSCHKVEDRKVILLLRFRVKISSATSDADDGEVSPGQHLTSAPGGQVVSTHPHPARSGVQLSRA